MSKFDISIAYIKSDMGKKEMDRESDRLSEKDDSYAGIQAQVNEEEKEIILTVFLQDKSVLPDRQYVVGQSTCMKDDLFDIRIGTELAYNRCKVRQLEKLKDNKSSIDILIEQCEEMEDVIEDINERLKDYYNNL